MIDSIEPSPARVEQVDAFLAAMDEYRAACDIGNWKAARAIRATLQDLLTEPIKL